MKLHELKYNKGARKDKFRKARGLGSGNGKTAGRGENGQNSRSGGGVRPGFEGGQNPLYRRLPKRGFNNVNHVEYQAVNISSLDKKFNDNDKVTIESLVKNGLVSKKNKPVKILGNGKLTKKLEVSTQAASKTAIAAIEKKGGTFKKI
ncbi:MAG: 50S ribosomal protein L15 [Mycoplasma sp.]|nr:50S ribosomal protein L15 [Mycoplasma sp.]